MKKVEAFQTSSGLVTTDVKRAEEDERLYKRKQDIAEYVEFNLDLAKEKEKEVIEIMADSRLDFMKIFFPELCGIFNDGRVHERLDVIRFLQEHKSWSIGYIAGQISDGKHVIK
jgi:hypothetical protein